MKRNINLGSKNQISNTNIAGNDINISPTNSQKKENKTVWKILVPLIISILSGLTIWYFTS